MAARTAAWTAWPTSRWSAAGCRRTVAGKRNPGRGPIGPQPYDLDADRHYHPADAGAIRGKAADFLPGIVIGARQTETRHLPRATLFGRDFSNFWVCPDCGRAPTLKSGYRLYPVELLVHSRVITRRYAFGIGVLVRGIAAFVSTGIGLLPCGPEGFLFQLRVLTTCA